MSETSRLRVAVVSDQSLVAQSIRAALEGRGFEATAVRWPSGLMETPTVDEIGALQPDVALFILDLDLSPRLREAQALIRGVPTHWVVLSGEGREPVWGAAIEAGAVTVMPNSTTLEDLVLVLQGVASEQFSLEETYRGQLLEEWHQAESGRWLLASRFRSLTPRERTVLRLLYLGESVHTMARLFEVSESTVRTQVRAILKKLDVGTQLAAVAAFRQLLEGEHQGHRTSS